MSNYGKLLLTTGLLSLCSVLPVTAQVGNGVAFTTPFPFYVGQAKMPAGSYTLIEPENFGSHVITVRSDDGRVAASTQVIGTRSLQPERRTVVVFEKYGETLYLDKVLLDGDTSGAMVLPTKAEKVAEENARLTEERSITAHGL
jgi:hypothetical protein